MTARFHIALPPEEERKILVSFYLRETQDPSAGEPKTQAQPHFKDIQARLQEASDRRLSYETEVHSDSLLLNRLMDRSLRDLHLLQTSIGGQRFFAAGVPWFVTLFGRDSLLTALQTLAYDQTPPHRHCVSWPIIRARSRIHGGMRSRARSCTSCA
jgi:glycogen debranching enzyme